MPRRQATPTSEKYDLCIMRIEAYYLTDPEGSEFSNKLSVTLKNKGHNA